MNLKILMFISYQHINNALKRVSHSIEIIKSNKEIPREGIKNLELGVRDMKRLLAKPEKDLIEGLKIIIESWNLGARQIEYFLEKKKKEEENSSMSNFL